MTSSAAMMTPKKKDLIVGRPHEKKSVSPSDCLPVCQAAAVGRRSVPPPSSTIRLERGNDRGILGILKNSRTIKLLLFKTKISGKCSP